MGADIVLKPRVVCDLLAVVCVAALGAQEAGPQSGRFAFSDGRGQTIALTIAEADGVAGFTWPASVDAGWDTALLGVQIGADANAVAPYVEIAAGGTSDRQYFAPGDSGLRWLNLSSIRGPAAGTRIALRGDGLTFSAPEASLRLFAGVPISRSRSSSLLHIPTMPKSRRSGSTRIVARASSR